MKNKDGFTLVEVLVVIAIIGVLAILILPNFIKTFSDASGGVAKAQENQVVDAAKLFVEDYCRNPGREEKGQCNSYSITIETNSTSTKKYTCLNTLQNKNYIENIVFKNNECVGFVVYDKDNDSKNYHDYKSYLQCGTAYQTAGINDIEDERGISVLENCGGDLYDDSNGNTHPTLPTIAEGSLMGGTDSNGDGNANFLRTNVLKKNIEKIIFTNSLGGRTPNNNNIFDVSKEKNNSVLAWVSDSDNNGLKEITIGANGKVYASTGSQLFNSLINLKSLEGMEYFDTSIATRLNSMFAFCLSLETVDVSHFDTSNVTSLNAMFYSNNDYGPMALTNIIGIENFDTSKVTDFRAMFQKCSNLLSLDLSRWITSSVIDMAFMFNYCSSLTSLDVSHFDTSNVTRMRAMFQYCQNLTSLNVSSFNTSKVKDMGNMFYGCSGLTSIDVSNFNTGSVTDMSGMFAVCNSLSDFSSLANFNTSNVIYMNSMFGISSGETRVGNPQINLNFLANWDVSKVTNMYCMFLNNNILSFVPFTSWDVSSVENFGSMFNQTSASTVTSLHGLEGWNTSSATNMRNLFYEGVSLTDISAIYNWNVTNVETLDGMFHYCSSLTSADLSNWVTSNVSNIGNMFYGCTNITSIDISNFNTSKVTNMNNMFRECSSLVTIYASNAFVTNNVSTSSGMFTDCTSIVGGAGTTYNGMHIDKEYAHIDGGTSNPGFFTRKN